MPHIQHRPSSARAFLTMTHVLAFTLGIVACIAVSRRQHVDGEADRATVSERMPWAEDTEPMPWADPLEAEWRPTSSIADEPQPVDWGVEEAHRELLRRRDARAAR